MANCTIFDNWNIPGLFESVKTMSISSMDLEIFGLTIVSLTAFILCCCSIVSSLKTTFWKIMTRSLFKEAGNRHYSQRFSEDSGDFDLTDIHYMRLATKEDLLFELLYLREVITDLLLQIDAEEMLQNNSIDYLESSDAVPQEICLPKDDESDDSYSSAFCDKSSELNGQFPVKIIDSGNAKMSTTTETLSDSFDEAQLSHEGIN